MRCPECDAVNPPDAVRCKGCGEKLSRKSRPAGDQEAEAKPAQGTQPRPRHPEPQQVEPARPRRRRRRRENDDEDGLAASIVPYKNPAALISYYLGYIGMIIGFGALVWMLLLFRNAEQGQGANGETIDSMQVVVKLGLGLGAGVGLAGAGLGVYGFLYGRSHRRAKGQAHATTGIVLGVVNVVGQLVVLVLILHYMTTQFPH